MVNQHRLIVSIVTYRSNIEQLKAAVASVRLQGNMIPILLVDNDSGDAYRQQLESLRQEGLEIINAPRNGGFGYGHNLAMMMAPPSDYFFILNPDVVLHEGAVDQLIAFLEARPEAGMVVPKVFYPDGALQPLNKRRPTVLDLALRLLLPPVLASLPVIENRMKYYSMLDKGYHSAYRLPFASGCCMMFRRELLMRLGGFDERFFLYFEDADITQRVNLLSSAWFCPDATITHAWQRGSRKSLKLLWIMLQSSARYFAKWGWRWW